jgi:hypothetical protein
MALSSEAALKVAGIDPAISLADWFKYAQLGLELYQSWAAMRAAAPGGASPALAPEAGFGDLLKYGQIGLEVAQALLAIKGAAVGAEGVTPPLKTDVGAASYTVVLQWTRTR